MVNVSSLCLFGVVTISIIITPYLIVGVVLSFRGMPLVDISMVLYDPQIYSYVARLCDIYS